MATATLSKNITLLSSDEIAKLPTTLIVIGMAGSGKTTLVQRILAECSVADALEETAAEAVATDNGEGDDEGNEKINNEASSSILTSTSASPYSPAYSINLDPAVASTPYEPNIDIRDTVDYRRVMSDYKLGPNGAILTSLNLFSTRFDQVMNILTARAAAETHKMFLIDTPGQIEVFTWSASGTIISESLATSYPTILVYVVDIARCVSPTTFMSNMLYACSIMYKSRIPFVMVFNKADVVDPEFALTWIKDMDSLHAALKSDQSYASSLTRSLSLVLDEFIQTITHVSVSALTGHGMDHFFNALTKAREEYIESYIPELKKRRELLKQREEERHKADLDKVQRDVRAAQQGRVLLKHERPSAGDTDDVEDEEDDDEEEDEDYFEESEPSDEEFERVVAQRHRNRADAQFLNAIGARIPEGEENDAEQ